MNPGKKKGYFELEDIFHIQYILTVLRYEKQKQKKKKNFPSICLFIHPIISWGANYERLSNGKVPTLKVLAVNIHSDPPLKGQIFCF